MFRRQTNTLLEDSLLAALAAERRLAEERALIPGLVQHDLANVLCRVTLSATALRCASGETERAKVAADIESGLKFMNGLLTGLRNLYETSGGVDDFARHDLARFVSDLIGERGIWPSGSATTQEGPPELWCSFSPKLMRHTLVNLVGNAVAYSRQTWVRVRLSAVCGGIWQLTVANGGPGIPQTHLPYLFDLDRRGNGTPDSGGHGIGLYLARRCLSAQGMELRVRSRPGLTVFGFAFHAAQRSAQAVDPRAA